MRLVIERLLVFETIVAGAFYFIASGLLFADVVAREIFSQSIWGAPRAAVLLSNACALIGISVAVGLNRHIRPTLFDFVFPNGLPRMLQRLSFAIGGSVLLVGTYFAVLFVSENRNLGFTAAPLDIEVWIPQVAIPYGLASASFKYFAFAAFPDIAPGDGKIAG